MRPSAREEASRPVVPGTVPAGAVRRSGSTRLAALVLAAAAGLGACSEAEAPAAQPTTGAGPTTSAPGPSAEPTAPEGGPMAEVPLPSGHVHAVGVDPSDGRILLATHEGLFRYDVDGPVLVGPVIDLMGFTVAGPGHFYASGHPGPGTDLPDPVGLIESTDAGRTWEPVSRQGESDFHALTSSDLGVIGFDGQLLLRSPDGLAWEHLTVPAAPFALAGSPDGAALLATTPEGVLRSADWGLTWQGVAGPVLQVVAWADERTAVGVAPDGAVSVSEDAGLTWQPRGSVGGAPQAVGAARTARDELRIVVVTGEQLLESLDGGFAFVPYAAPAPVSPGAGL